MKTQRFANIWKAALAPFAPPNYVPVKVWIIEFINMSSIGKSEYFDEFQLVVQYEWCQKSDVR